MIGFPKGPSRKTLKGRKERAESAQVQRVRALCVDRDGDCRMANWTVHVDDLHYEEEDHVCDGESEWAHFGDKKRAKTRGLPPDVRHTTEGSLMLCTAAHQDYDAHRLTIEPLSDRGCDGPLKFR